MNCTHCGAKACVASLSLPEHGLKLTTDKAICPSCLTDILFATFRDAVKLNQETQ